jgi:hypothetical protein
MNNLISKLNKLLPLLSCEVPHDSNIRGYLEFEKIDIYNDKKYTESYILHCNFKGYMYNIDLAEEFQITGISEIDKLFHESNDDKFISNISWTNKDLYKNAWEWDKKILLIKFYLDKLISDLIKPIFSKDSNTKIIYNINFI